MWWCSYFIYFCKGRLKFKPYDIDQKFVPSLPFTGFVHKDFTDSEKLMGSKLTMKYPAVHMMEPGARGEILSIAFSSAGQHQDAGAKLVHEAPNTTGQIISKSISKNGGRSSYRGLVRVEPGAHNSKNNVVCDALILDPESRSDTYPYIEIAEQDVQIGHEASVSRIGEEQMFYLLSRGLTEQEASTMIVNGFIEPLVKELPMEYAIEMNRLIQLQMEGSVG